MTNQKFATCFGDGQNIRNGGWITTRAKTESGIMKAALHQVWSGSPAALCGYNMVAVEIDGKVISASK